VGKSLRHPRQVNDNGYDDDDDDDDDMRYL
jgi:hypothetical protein